MPLNVIVVGAGIGGPVTAIALAKQGHNVTVYEREKSTTDVGFAFRITQNCDICLKHCDVNVSDYGLTTANTTKQLDTDGTVIREVQENRDPAMAKKAISGFASRPALAKAIMKKAVLHGVKFKNGVKIQGVDTNNTEVILEDGTRVTTDLIIGADGVHSYVRKHVVDPAVYKPRSSIGQNCIRFMVPSSVIENDEVLSELWNNNARMVTWKGVQKRIIVYPVDGDTQYSFICTHPEELSNQAIFQDKREGTAVNYNKKISLEDVHKIYQEFDPRLHRLFDKVDPNGFCIWNLTDLEELPTWSRNRTIVIGDAAHVVLPYGFSGASMAVEDGVMLSEFLPGDVKKEDIPARLRLLEQVRKPRVGYIRDFSRLMGRGSEKLAAAVGDYMKWLAEYDTLEVARAALKDFEGEQVQQIQSML